MTLSLFSNKKTHTESPERILEHAHIKAEKIVEKALKKSEEILEDLAAFREEMKKEMKMIFRQSADSYIHTISNEATHFANECNALVPEIKTMYEQETQKSIALFQTKLEAELIPLHAKVESEIKESIHHFQALIDQQWIEAKKDIELYKQERKQTIEKEVTEKTDALVVKVFGNSLTRIQQQQLVIDALEKAKEEGVFHS